MKAIKSVVPKKPKKLNFTFAFNENDAEMIEAIKKVALEDDRPFGNWLRVRVRQLYDQGILTKRDA